jgi:uncharacterized protein (TIGR03435 family)
MKSLCAIFTVSFAIAQPLPTFQAASVKVAPPGMNIVGYNDLPENIAFKNLPMKTLLAEAFDVKEYQISGPPWLATDTTRYVIEARCQRSTAPDQVRLMLQALLMEKFKLAAHIEKKELAVYALTVDTRGPKIKKTKYETAGGFTDGSTWPGNANGAWTLANLAEILSPLLEKPILDETGLKGMFEVRLHWTPEDKSATAGAASIFNALRQQLGLRLIEKNTEIEVLVIDHLEKAPGSK